MFTKSPISKSMIDAVNSVIGEGKSDDVRDRLAAKRDQDADDYNFKDTKKKDEKPKARKVTGNYGKTHKDDDEKDESVKMPFKDRLIEHAKSLDEAITGIKKGAFHKWLGKSAGAKITSADIEKGLKAGGHAAKMANFARNAKKFHHEEFDFEIETTAEKKTELIEGIVDHEEIAKHLVDKHGTKLTKELVKSEIGDMDEPHKIDTDEVWHHVDKMRGVKESVNLSELSLHHGGYSLVTKHAHAIGADPKNLSDEHRKIVGERIRKEIGAKRVHVTSNGSVFHEEMKPPFEGGKKVCSGTKTDKSGAKHTPMSHVRHLARLGLKKVKQETK